MAGVMQIPLSHFKLKNKVIASYWYFAIICFTSLFKEFNWRLIIYVLGVFLCLLSYVKLVTITDTNSIFSTNSSLLFIIFLFINIHHEFVFSYLPFFSFACFWTKCWGKMSELQFFLIFFWYLLTPSLLLLRQLLDILHVTIPLEKAFRYLCCERL